MTSRRTKVRKATGFVAAAMLLVSVPIAAQECVNDYPTAARADYVFGCMEANGGASDALRHCACSIDVIASILPYAKYEAAETVMSVIQVGGEKAALFQDPALVEKVADLRRAQAEGEILCF
jgi:hypothetical protein